MPTALLVVDVQNTLCQGKWAAYGVDLVVPRIVSLARRVKQIGGYVVYIQHEEEHDAMRRGSIGWKLCAMLEPSPDDIFIRKTTCDSFFKTDLKQNLERIGVDHVLVCGMQTEFCVDSTVRGALENGFAVTVVSDAHTTLETAVLTAPQIIAHHNLTFANLGNFGPLIKVLPAETAIDA
jgi:nicotinamidase-related amidase